MKAQLISQFWAVGTAIVVSAVVSFIALMIIKVLIGLRPTDQQEREGLDLTSHGERAYNRAVTQPRRPGPPGGAAW